MRYTTLPLWGRHFKSQSTLYVLRSSYVYRTTRHPKLNTSPASSQTTINRGKMILALVHSCWRGVLHFLAHKTALLTLTLRHSNTIKNNINADSTKGKKQKPRDVHITFVTDPTKLVQPYKTTSSEHKLPNVDNFQHKDQTWWSCT